MLNLQNHAIIALKGRAGAGKSTAATLLVDRFHIRGQRTRRMSFAAPLKEVCNDVFGTAFGVPRTAFFGSQADKNAPLEAIPGWTGRKILQYIGTEGFRHVSQDTWPNYAINKAREYLSTDYQHVIFDDLRFLSEADAVRKAGGVIVEIKGGHANQGGTDQGIKGHASESEVALIEPDHIIVNDGELSEFYDLLGALL